MPGVDSERFQALRLGERRRAAGALETRDEHRRDTATLTVDGELDDSLDGNAGHVSSRWTKL